MIFQRKKKSTNFSFHFTYATAAVCLACIILSNIFQAIVSLTTRDMNEGQFVFTLTCYSYMYMCVCVCIRIYTHIYRKYIYKISQQVEESAEIGSAPQPQKVEDLLPSLTDCSIRDRSI